MECYPLRANYASGFAFITIGKLLPAQISTHLSAGLHKLFQRTEVHLYQFIFNANLPSLYLFIYVIHRIKEN